MTTEVKWPAAKVRSTFVDYFCKDNGHTFIPSSKVVPERDPTLLFANSGMNQFKPLFLGIADPKTDFGKLKRVANSQKCIRAGGKHNDLDDVGKDTYHHTFFEMLGNWSFGDYFKEEAITMAWDLLTRVYGMDKERLYVTYFEGNPHSNPPLPPDEEARAIWAKFVPDSRIIKGNMKDNFWEMGDTGPCGPCSEIHYDRIGGRDAASRVNSDDPMVIEIWNNVFMQFNREADGSLIPLPAKHVDTGMGFERITSILQNVLSNYDTDVWSSIFKKIQTVTGCKEAYDYAGPDKSHDVVVAYRVVADHIRTITTALVDGAAPDSTGRGYVLRRVVRRAIRYAHEYLGAKEGFFEQLVDAVSESLGDFFPELRVENNLKRCKALIQEEEKSFGKTYTNGMKHFQEYVKKTPAGGTISGADSFILHDRFGFPVDLTVLMAEAANLKVDVKGFNVEMEKHKEDAGEKVRAAGGFLDGYAVDDMRKRSLRTTNDDAKYLFDQSLSGTVLVVYNSATSALVASTAECKTGLIGIVLNRTNFYAESGGQIFDIGTLTCGTGTFKVERVLNFGGYVCHIGSVEGFGALEVGDTVVTHVDFARRRLIAANHTMTHQLNHVLRNVLQDGHPEAFTEVNQKGSYVNDEALRFDFSWNTKVELPDLELVEALLSKAVSDDLKVYTKEIPLKRAMEIKSMRCMFDEKYGDAVKVVTVGIPIETVLRNPGDEATLRKFSIELCGGTHVTSLGSVGAVVISGEDALMKGVRRMTIATGAVAGKAIVQGQEFIAAFQKLTAADCGGDHDERVKELSVMTKNLNESTVPLIMKAKLRIDIDNAIKATNAAKKDHGAVVLKNAEVYAVQFVGELAADAKYAVVGPHDACPPNRDALQAIAEGIQKARPNLPVLVIGVDAKKPAGLVLCLSGNKGLNAVEWVKASTGKGGGKPNAAQGGFVTDQAASVVASANKYASGLTL